MANTYFTLKIDISAIILHFNLMQEIKFFASLSRATNYFLSKGVLSRSPHSSWNPNKSAHASSYPSFYLQTPT